MLKKLTQEYIRAFENKDLDTLNDLFQTNFALEDPVVKRIEGKDKAIEAIKGIFDSCEKLTFKAKNIYVDGETSIIEFILTLDDTTLTGTDIIEWEDKKMKELRAYLDIPKAD